MKPTAFLRPFRLLVAATLLSGLAPAITFAQKKPDQPSPAAETLARLDFNLSGDDLTVQKAVDAIVSGFRKAGQTVNVVVRGEAGALGLPPINLQRVTFPQALQAVALSVDPPLMIDGGGDEELFILSANTKDSAPAKMRAFNVSAFLRRPENWPEDGTQHAKEEERYKERFVAFEAVVTKALALGAKVNPGFVKPEVEMEDRTGILFATGSPQALEIVAEVVRALCEPYAKSAPQAGDFLSNILRQYEPPKPAPPAKP